MLLVTMIHACGCKGGLHAVLWQIILLNLVEEMAAAGTTDEERENGRVIVSEARFRYEAVPGIFREQIVHLGTGLKVNNDDPAETELAELRVPLPGPSTEYDPLFLHINRNRTYYFGRRCSSA